MYVYNFQGLQFSFREWMYSVIDKAKNTLIFRNKIQQFCHGVTVSLCLKDADYGNTKP